jgi:type II secretory pathway component GspD/PulD (secretin)
MKREVRSLAIPAAVFTLLLSGSIAWAVEVDLDKRITLDLEKAELQKVLALYQDVLGVEVDIDPSIDRTISISFDDITVRTSLNAICESAKCRWELIDGDPPLLRFDRDDQGEEPQADMPAMHEPEARQYVIDSPVSLQLTDADATKVLEVAAKIMGAKLLMDRKLAHSTVTINADAVPLSTVLDTVCEKLDCAWKLVDGDPPALEVDSR